MGADRPTCRRGSFGMPVLGVVGEYDWWLGLMVFLLVAALGGRRGGPSGAGGERPVRCSDRRDTSGPPGCTVPIVSCSPSSFPTPAGLARSSTPVCSSSKATESLRMSPSCCLLPAPTAYAASCYLISRPIVRASSSIDSCGSRALPRSLGRWLLRCTLQRRDEHHVVFFRRLLRCRARRRTLLRAAVARRTVQVHASLSRRNDAVRLLPG